MDAELTRHLKVLETTGPGASLRRSGIRVERPEKELIEVYDAELGRFRLHLDDLKTESDIYSKNSFLRPELDRSCWRVEERDDGRVEITASEIVGYKCYSVERIRLEKVAVKVPPGGCRACGSTDYKASLVVGAKLSFRDVDRARWSGDGKVAVQFEDLTCLGCGVQRKLTEGETINEQRVTRKKEVKLSKLLGETTAPIEG